MFSVTTQTLCFIVDKTVQTDLINLVNKQSQTGSEEITLGIPKFLSSIQNFHFPLAKMYIPASVFSPMATLLTPMGNVVCFFFSQAQNLRKKVSRIEDDNESLVLQLKKMATQARSMCSKYFCY